MTARELEAQRLQKEWNENPRWKGITRTYSAEAVVALQGGSRVQLAVEGGAHVAPHVPFLRHCRRAGQGRHSCGGH